MQKSWRHIDLVVDSGVSGVRGLAAGHGPRVALRGTGVNSDM